MTVHGGWQRGDEVIRMVEGVDGIARTERDAVFLTRDGETWSVGGRTMVRFAPG